MDIMTIISNAAGELIAPTTAAYVLAAIGLNIHFGMTGLMNMGQAGFMLLGAYGTCSPPYARRSRSRSSTRCCWAFRR